MARASFRASNGDRTRMQELPSSADDLPETVSVDLDDKDPQNFEIVEVDDTPERDRGRPTEVSDDLAGQEFKRAKGEPEEDQRIHYKSQCTGGEPRQNKPAAGERRVDGEVGEFRQKKRGRRGEHQRTRRKADGNHRAGDDGGNAEFCA